MTTNEITSAVINEALNIHRQLGPGLFESVYKECLFYSLAKNDIKVIKEVPIPLIYNEIKMDCGFRADLIVEDRIIVELKSIEVINDIHKKQVLTYLRLMKLKLGLLINFNNVLLKDGIKRIINGYDMK